MGHTPDPALITPFIEAAKEIEAEGVKAITTSCGFLSPFQPMLAAAVRIPVFASALIQVPLIQSIIGPDRKIGIFTERAQYMNEDHFRPLNWSSKTAPVVVKGMKADAKFPQVYIENSDRLDFEVLRQEMKQMAREFIEDNPDAGAILFECTNMCPFSADVQEVASVPVFDINSLINWVHHAVEPRRYGH